MSLRFVLFLVVVFDTLDLFGREEAVDTAVIRKHDTTRGANGRAGITLDTNIVVNSCKVVNYPDSTRGTGFFALMAGDAGIVTYLFRFHTLASV